MTDTVIEEPGTELAVLEPEVEAEVEPAEPQPLSKAKAVALDKRIRSQGDKLDTSAAAFAELLEQAAVGQIHVALELPSWTAYVADVARDNQFLQMLVKNKTDRKELAVKMSAAGMSQRAIASAFGVSQKTIDRDLEGEEFETDTITDLSGKTQPRNKPAKNDNVIDAEVVDVDVPEAKQAPITQDFKDEMYQLANDVEALQEVMDDDRFAKARKRVAKDNLNDLQEIISKLQTIVDNLMA